jgi:hypothetical protein
MYGKCDGAKSLSGLLAALKVKAKKAYLLYIEKCRDIHQILIFQFFIPHSAEFMSKKRKTAWKRPTVEKLEGITKMDKKERSTSPILQAYGIPICTLLTRPTSQDSYEQEALQEGDILHTHKDL